MEFICRRGDNLWLNRFNTVCSGVKRWALLSPSVAPELAERVRPPPGWSWTTAEWFLKEWPSIAADPSAYKLSHLRPS